MLGDFNTTEDPIDKGSAHLNCTAVTDALRDICHTWEIQDGWRLTHPNNREYTYQANTRGNDIMSQLDRIYVTRQLTPLTRKWGSQPSLVPTDHKLATVKYASNEAPLIRKGKWMMPLQILENEKFIKAVVIHRIKLQLDLETLQCENTDRETSNLH